MAVYRLSAKAASDLDAIYEYTILRFGLDQARGYLLGMQEQFQILAEQPAQGRQADALARGRFWVSLQKITESKNHSGFWDAGSLRRRTRRHAGTWLHLSDEVLWQQGQERPFMRQSAVT